MRGCFASWLAVGLWGVSAVTGAVLFVRGQTEPAHDGRTALVLSEQEAVFMLTEMRGMMGSVQGILKGLASNDLRGIQDSARASGAALGHGVPASLTVKLPLSFKEQGQAVHAGFDDLAVAASQGETMSMLTGRLATQLGRCVTCHATYRLR
ncbi:MAG: hypothetical protein H7840_07125 [Alphaproteobacteria bacterium]